MKSLILKSLTVSGLALAAFATSSILSDTADAAQVATTKDVAITRLYTQNGTLVQNRGLAANTPWRVGKTIQLNGLDYYQVSTNEYLKSTDTASLTGSNDEQNSKVDILVEQPHSDTYDDRDGSINGHLDQFSDWIVSKVVFESYTGKTYYQISPHQFISLYNYQVHGDEGTLPRVEVSHLTDLNKNIDPDTGEEVNTYKPNLVNINNYFAKYLNALHKANGTAPVTVTSDMMNYAQQRADQQVGNTLDHTTASRKTSENLSGAGFDYMLKWANVKSDKDAAYYLLSRWYDEGGNLTGNGQPGHFGHRAALIYSGPNVGLGISGNAAAFTADWDYATFDQFNALYDYTGSNPNTKFISKDSI
ncbi:SLAP domain-containing protein [Companilactobacillus baiquanensis]|uniref:SLAP domain-containing protein n=1 Tax=Companilactobacillus baiquanensis TaxID=2486005 RepID=A0ABW1UXS0_9LACO|nr:SLAP domain-containing protein [Companilactobacillus baiquanensis]